jgi:hypothetical protein
MCRKAAKKVRPAVKALSDRNEYRRGKNKSRKFYIQHVFGDSDAPKTLRMAKNSLLPNLRKNETPGFFFFVFVQLKASKRLGFSDILATNLP